LAAASLPHVDDGSVRDEILPSDVLRDKIALANFSQECLLSYTPSGVENLGRDLQWNGIIVADHFAQESGIGTHSATSPHEPWPIKAIISDGRHRCNRPMRIGSMGKPRSFIRGPGNQ
jgi:hypothetical protein